MGIENGQKVDEENSNAAWLPKGVEGGTALGKIALNNSADAASGTAITNAQRELNALWSFLGGLVNQVKTYVPTWTWNSGFVSSADSLFTRVDAISKKYDPTDGHKHSGVAGDGGQITTSSLTGYPLRGAQVRGTDIASPSGTSHNVTSLLVGKIASNNSTTKGVAVNSPYNEIVIKRLSGSEADSHIEDATGNVVFGRLTESAGTWTLSYYSDISGVETAYTMLAGDTSAGIKWYFVELFNPLVDLPVYPEHIFVPSDNYTQDIIDASATQSGKVNTSAQTFAGKKTFNAGAGMNSQPITDVQDPTNNQDAATKAHVAAALASLGAIGVNRIINGGMRINQRAVGDAVNMSDGVYNLDRWHSVVSNAGVVNSQRVTSSVPAGFTHAMKLTVTTADASLGAGDVLAFCQRIEGNNCAGLDFGLSTANSVTLSFWVRSSKTGTYCVSIMNSAANRSRTAEYTISVADTWEQKTVTIAGDTSGTWLTDTGIGIRLFFGLMAGSSYQQAAGSWGTSGNAIGTSNQVNWLDTNGATFYITGVKLEKGTAATPWYQPLISQELAECKRYYEKSFLLSTVPANGGSASTFSTIDGMEQQPLIPWVASPNNVGGRIKFTVQKRAAPTVTLLGNSSGHWAYNVLSSFAATNGAMTFSGSINSNAPDENGFCIINNVSSSSLCFVQGHWTASAEL